jgi:putative FmdB family regulatory protein
VPLYEYQCKKCKHKFEKIQKFSDRPLKKCPECGGVLEKVLHAPGVHFKGSGWYVTDYGGKKADPSHSTDAETPAGKTAEKKTETKADAKPEAKKPETKRGHAKR